MRIARHPAEVFKSLRDVWPQYPKIVLISGKIGMNKVHQDTELDETAKIDIQFSCDSSGESAVLKIDRIIVTEPNILSQTSRRYHPCWSSMMRGKYFFLFYVDL